MVRLKIRLEDFLSPEQDPAENTERKPNKAAIKQERQKVTEIQTKLNDARARSDPSAPELERDLKKEKRKLARLLGHTTAAKPGQPGTSGSKQSRPLDETEGDVFSVDIEVSPLEATLEANGFRFADKLTCTIPFIDAPLPSDVIRACQVDFFLGTIPEDAWGDPTRWRLPVDRRVLMFRGWVDAWDTNHSDSDSTVQFEARSMESVLIDAKINPMAPDYKIKGSGEKITDYLNRILARLPSTAGKTTGQPFRAEWFNAALDAEPVLNRTLLLRSLQTAKARNAGTPPQAEPVAQTAPEAAPSADPGTSDGPPDALGDTRLPNKAPSQEMTVWDLFTQACELAGAIPVYDPILDPDHILVRHPTTIFEDVQDGFRIPGGSVDGFERVFALRQQGAGSRVISSDVRLMVWGNNVKEIKTSRKLGRIKAPTVEVVANNPDAPPGVGEGKRTLVARYPSKSMRGTTVGEKGQNKTEEVVTRVVQGVRTLKQLQQIALGLYHAISRQELSVKIQTDELASFIDGATAGQGLSNTYLANPQIHNDDPDLLRLRPGTPMRVMVARQVKDPTAGLVITPLSDVFERRPDEIAKFLTQQFQRNSGITDPNDTLSGLIRKDSEIQARRIADAVQKSKPTDLFYVRTINYRFESDTGLGLEMELVNFVESRSLPRNLGTTDQQINAALKKVKTETLRRVDAKERAQVEKAIQRALSTVRGPGYIEL